MRKILLVLALSLAAFAVAPQIIVQHRIGLPESKLSETVSKHALNKVKLDSNTYLIILKPGIDKDKAILDLKNKKVFKFVAPNKIYASQLIVNDPLASSEYHIPLIGADLAWDVSQGKGIIVAVLDSGLNPHEDLVIDGNGYNFFNGNKDVTDYRGHGSYVAGTIGAQINNGLGLAAVAGGTTIMPLRIADDTGFASSASLYSALIWARDHGARVANISYAPVHTDPTVVSGALALRAAGGLTFVSAGNYATEMSIPKGVAPIVVGATTSSDTLASWSNYGESVHIVAPGEAILSTNNSNGYVTVSGTSFSSPITGAVAALVMSTNTGLSAAQVENILFSTAVDLGPVGVDNVYGYGRVNALDAVKLAASTTAVDTIAPTVSVASPVQGSIVSGLVYIDVLATDASGISSVNVKINNTILGSDSVPPYSFVWDSTQVANGTYTIIISASDFSNNTAAAPVSVIVSNYVAPDTTPPVVYLNSTVKGANIQLNASATDISTLKYKLYINNVLATTGSGNNFTYNINTKKVKSPYAIKVEFTDTSGNTGYAYQ